MTHLAWREVAEGAQRRAEQRCAEDGHAWDPMGDEGYACQWCLALSANPESAPNWRLRALSHATVVRALLSVRAPAAGTAGAIWLAEALETLRLAKAEKLPVEVKS